MDRETDKIGEKKGEKKRKGRNNGKQGIAKVFMFLWNLPSEVLTVIFLT